MTRFRCRHCGDDTGTSDSHVCGRCATLPTLERGRHVCQQATHELMKCVHCRVVGSGNPCPQCAALIADLDGLVVEPPAETEDARRERFHAARVASVRASHVRGFRCLLARALDPQNATWAHIDH